MQAVTADLLLSRVDLVLARLLDYVMAELQAGLTCRNFDAFL